MVLAALAGLPAPVALARKSPRSPTAAQIRAAIRRAEHSRDLWATVNICNTKHNQHIIGIRGQMPSLGFASRLSMDVQIDYWSIKDRRFKPDPGVTKLILLGQVTNGLRQGGVSFRFKPQVILSGEITFIWKRDGKVLGRAHRKTGHGLKHVDFGDPPGYSTATCRILH
jgi:hypothetical protein